jgi:hypothetical protein
MLLSSRKYDPGCSSQIPDPDLDFLPIPYPKRHRIRIRDTGHIDIFCNSCFIVFYYKDKNLKKKMKNSYVMFKKPGVKIIYQILLDSQ